MTAILGGGLSGLSAAYYLLKSLAQKITVIEGSNALGGWVHSIKYPKEGFIFEKGPRTVRPRGLQGLNTLSLVEELDLSSKIIAIPTTHPTAQNRLLYVNKKLHPLPSSLSALFKICPPFSKPLIFSAFKDLITPKVVKNDESIYSFVERRFGKEIAEYAISSMICGICAGNAKEISVKFLMAEIFEWEQTYGSVLKGLYKSAISNKNPQTSQNAVCNSKLAKRALEEKWSVWSLTDGLQQLTDGLGRCVREKGANFKFNSECIKLEFHDKKVTCVFNEQREGSVNEEFDHVICSLPATTLSQLVSDQHPTLSKELSEIKSVTVAVVNIAYKGKHLKHNAFGFLVPPREKLPILGVIFDSCNFEYGDWTVLTVMMGGHWFEEYFGSATEESIEDTALKQVSSILNINEKPLFTHVSILQNCIPQYTVGHHDRVKRVLSYIEEHKLPLTVIGASYYGVGINDVIFSAKTAVENFNNKKS